MCSVGVRAWPGGGEEGAVVGFEVDVEGVWMGWVCGWGVLRAWQ